jgi:signal transduction histidine kinase
MAFVLGCAIIFQLMAAIVALRLIPLTGKRVAWVLISAALILMVGRHIVPLYGLLSGDPSIQLDLSYEIVGLALSFLMMLGVIGIAPIFTERKRMEQRLAESQRMVTIGETTAMVGHDLRNPLQAIFSTIHIAKKKLEKQSGPGGDPIESSALIGLLETIEKESEYMNKIVSDLQNYSKPVELELKPVEMESAVKEILSTIHVPSNVKVTVNFSMSTHTHMLDPTVIRRVFTNLITNALQAMPNGGELRIEASDADGAHVIEIKDTGSGIPQENLQRIFDPLFTTKTKGQGLGLAVCRRLVEAQGGSITVESKLGEGTTFTVKLPS